MTTYLGKVKVKVGPVTSEFSGKARFVERDGDARRAVVDARGKEARGTGNAAATITCAVHDAGEHSRVSVDTDLKIVGKLAQFGSGMLQQVSEKLLGEFVESLEARLAGGHETETDATSVAAPNGRPYAPKPSQPRSRRSRRRSTLLELAGGGALKKYAAAVLGAVALAAIVFTLRSATDRPQGSVTTPYLFRGVDLAAFAVALVARLRAVGVVVSASGPAGFVEALRQFWPSNSVAVLLERPA